jgi:hypothetical protein
MIRREIIVNYLRTWFFLDLLASFPYNWVFDFDNIDENSADSGSIFRTP